MRGWKEKSVRPERSGVAEKSKDASRAHSFKMDPLVGRALLTLLSTLGFVMHSPRTFTLLFSFLLLFLAGSTASLSAAEEPVRGSRFDSSVDLSNFRTSHAISLEGSKFARKLDMALLQVGADLFMGKAAEFAEVALRGDEIRGHLLISSLDYLG